MGERAAAKQIRKSVRRMVGRATQTRKGSSRCTLKCGGGVTPNVSTGPIEAPANAEGEDPDEGHCSLFISDRDGVDRAYCASLLKRQSKCPMVRPDLGSDECNS
jgi:hypothetical protein